MIEETTVWGYLKVPYPYLDNFLEKVNSLKGKHVHKDFPDFIMPPEICPGNALLAFGFIFRYENDFENLLMSRFEAFLKQVSYLDASLQINIDDKKYFFVEYVTDGTETLKNENVVSVRPSYPL